MTDQKESPYTTAKTDANATLLDVVIGMSDGLIVPFALASGLSVVVGSSTVIVVAGLAEICAGSIAMGLGGYFSRKSEFKETQDGLGGNSGKIEEVDPGKEETRRFFANLGLSENLQEMATEEVAKDKNKWAETFRQFEPSVLETGKRPAARSGWNIALSYAGGGIIPLIPYFFNEVPMSALKYSAIITLLCLFVFGWFRSRVSGVFPLWGGLRTALTGAAAAAAAYGVASIFQSA